MFNLTETEKRGLAAIDQDRLERFIDAAILNEWFGDMENMDFYACDSHVMRHLRIFEERLADYRNSKAAEKRRRTLYSAEKAGRELSFAASQMKERLAREIKDGKLFRIDNFLHPPIHFTADISVRIAYQWRQAEADEWSYGAMTVRHRFKKISDLGETPKRKQSAWKVEEERQADLYAVWDHLRKLAQLSLQVSIGTQL